jgi:hypothetical protein
MLWSSLDTPYPLTLPSKDKLGGYLVPYNMMMGGRDVDKIGPALKRVVMWQSHKDSDDSESVEVKCKVTGKDVANMLDTIGAIIMTP